MNEYVYVKQVIFDDFPTFTIESIFVEFLITWKVPTAIDQRRTLLDKLDIKIETMKVAPGNFFKFANKYVYNDVATPLHLYCLLKDAMNKLKVNLKILKFNLKLKYYYLHFPVLSSLYNKMMICIIDAICPSRINK